MIALVVLYYAAPLDRIADVPFWLSLSLGLLLLTAVTAYQLRAIIRSPHPAVRGIEAVAVTVPLFLILFAAAGPRTWPPCYKRRIQRCVYGGRDTVGRAAETVPA